MAGLSNYRGGVAVVTGASSGIGAEIGRELARRGACVALVARREQRLRAVADEVTNAGGQASVHMCDVAKRAEVEATCKEVLERWGHIDLLINNAGIGRHILIIDQDVDEIERLMQTNYMGSVYWIKAVLPMMLERRSGFIVNVSSMAGLMPQPDEAAYSASKFALSTFSHALGYEVAPYNIHVMAVHPVLVRTEMTNAEFMERIPKAAMSSFIDADVFVAETLRALERGKTSVVIPRRFGAVSRLAAVSPGLIGGAIARLKLRSVPNFSAHLED